MMTKMPFLHHPLLATSGSKELIFSPSFSTWGGEAVGRTVLVFFLGVDFHLESGRGLTALGFAVKHTVSCDRSNTTILADVQVLLPVEPVSEVPPQ